MKRFARLLSGKTTSARVIPPTHGGIASLRHSRAASGPLARPSGSSVAQPGLTGPYSAVKGMPSTLLWQTNVSEPGGRGGTHGMPHATHRQTREGGRGGGHKQGHCQWYPSCVSLRFGVCCGVQGSSGVRIEPDMTFELPEAAPMPSSRSDPSLSPSHLPAASRGPVEAAIEEPYTPPEPATSALVNNSSYTKDAFYAPLRRPIEEATSLPPVGEKEAREGGREGRAIYQWGA